MSKKTTGEAAFWQQMKKSLGERGFQLHRVEPGGVCPGIPDVHFIHKDGTSGWIELKCATATRVPELRPDQSLWLSRYHKHKGNAWLVMLDVRPGIDRMVCWHARSATSLRRRSLVVQEAIDLATVVCNWDALAKLIKGKQPKSEPQPSPPQPDPEEEHWSGQSSAQNASQPPLPTGRAPRRGRKTRPGAAQEPAGEDLEHEG